MEDSSRVVATVSMACWARPAGAALGRRRASDHAIGLGAAQRHRRRDAAPIAPHGVVAGHRQPPHHPVGGSPRPVVGASSPSPRSLACPAGSSSTCLTCRACRSQPERRPWPAARLSVDLRREGGDGRELEEGAERQGDPKRLIGAGDDAHRSQRVAGEVVEEVVGPADLGPAAEHVRPDVRQGALRRRQRRFGDPSDGRACGRRSR